MSKFNLSWLQTLQSHTVWAIAGVLGVPILNAAMADPEGFTKGLHIPAPWSGMLVAAIAAYGVYRRKNPVQGVPGKDPKV